MIAELKVAVCAFVAYVLLAINLFYQVQSLDASSVALPCLCLGLGWAVTFVLPHSEVAKRAAFLGSVFGISLLLSFGCCESSWRYFAWYMMSLAFFHWSEYVMIAIYNSHKLSSDSFLLNHSPEYQIAAVASWVEFIIELWLFPWLKTHYYISLVGLILMLGGEALRKVAMYTAKASFSHIVENKKADDHVLVTSGVYAWSRHPSYVGWFWWSIVILWGFGTVDFAFVDVARHRHGHVIYWSLVSDINKHGINATAPSNHSRSDNTKGTQVTLCNPLCLVGYIWASWRFFNERIHDEELSLLVFFGDKYVDYKKKVGTGLPFIKGFEITPDMLSSK